MFPALVPADDPIGGHNALSGLLETF